MESGATVFISIHVFVVSLSSRRLSQARRLPGPLALPVPMLVLDLEFLKINHFRPRSTSLTASLW